MTFNVSKINLGGSVCTEDTYFVKPLVLSIESPVCPFNFTLAYALPTYLDITNNEHEATPSAIIWELLNDVGVSITSLTQTEDFGSFSFPEKFLQSESDYEVRAYVVIDDIGESDWSYKSVSTKVLHYGPEEETVISDWGVQDIETGNRLNTCSMKMANTAPISTVTLSVEQGQYIRLKITTIDDTDTASDRYSQEIQDASNEFVGGVYYKNPDLILDRLDPFVCCGDGGNNIYIGMTVSSYTVVNEESGQIAATFIRHVLYKFDLSSNRLSELTDSIETPLLNKEGYAMCVHGNYLYLIGGYGIDSTGAWVSPLEEERTFLKYDLTTFVMTEVEVIGAKPRDYRACKLIASDEGILKFSGRGKTIVEDAVQNAPEMWFFEFASKTWKAMPMFPYPDYLAFDDSRANLVFLEDVSERYYNLIIESFMVSWFRYHKEERFWEYVKDFNYEITGDYWPSLAGVGQYFYCPYQANQY